MDDKEKPFVPPSMFPPMPENELLIAQLMESCPGKAAISAVLGFGMGGVFGTFMSSVDWNVNSEEYLKMSTKDQMKYALRDMRTRAFSTAKGFGTVGGIFAATECIIEGYRAKSDMVNGVSAGCTTGALLAAKAGPKAALFGCAGFAAFSGAIDYWMKHS